MTTEIIGILTALAFAVSVTYAIQYRSVISPGYVEFDDRIKKELKFMRIYNKIMDNGFRIYIILLVVSAVLMLYSDSTVFAIAGLLIQAVYFLTALAVMLSVYYRNRLYWKRYGSKCRRDRGCKRNAA